MDVRPHHSQSVCTCARPRHEPTYPTTPTALAVRDAHSVPHTRVQPHPRALHARPLRHGTAHCTHRAPLSCTARTSTTAWHGALHALSSNAAQCTVHSLSSTLTPHVCLARCSARGTGRAAAHPADERCVEVVLLEALGELLERTCKRHTAAHGTGGFGGLGNTAAHVRTRRVARYRSARNRRVQWVGNTEEELG